ncbi:DNA-binding protein [Chromobacterium phragmitis]|uniref:DNA-binding protein n=2 Tax=Chromobacterium phragmitis TaxID=2202141 RepID=A0ABV0IQW6_9NEIS
MMMSADIYSRIRQAAFELVSEGAWPTVVDVRARLGSGSNTTINNTLKAWRQEFLGKVALSARRPDWPPALTEAFDQVWQKACDESERQLESVRREIEAEGEALRDAHAKTQDKLEQLEAETQSLRHELELRAARQVELDSLLQRERAQTESLAREREALLEAQESARAELKNERKLAIERKEEQDTLHQQQLQEARNESERKEALAYERLEGLRVRLYQQVEEERREMKLQQQRLEEALDQARQDAAKVENLWRERLLERERENGGLQAKLELLAEREGTLLREAADRQQAVEAGQRRTQELAERCARAEERAMQDRALWLERIGAAWDRGERQAEGQSMRDWLHAVCPGSE